MEQFTRSQISLKKSFLLIFDYFTLILIKNIETNFLIRKNIQKDGTVHFEDKYLHLLIHERLLSFHPLCNSYWHNVKRESLSPLFFKDNEKLCRFSNFSAPVWPVSGVGGREFPPPLDNPWISVYCHIVCRDARVEMCEDLVRFPPTEGGSSEVFQCGQN